VAAEQTGVERVTRRPADPVESTRASRGWWDNQVGDYLKEHGSFLGPARFVWGPEGLDEADAALLGDVADRLVLEVGAGAAQCSRWLAGRGAHPVALDVSAGMLDAAQALDEQTGLVVPSVQADAGRLPFAAGVFDLACSAHGALPFVADAGAVHSEVARVLRPGGRWVFSVSHPFRWCFPDDPTETGLVAEYSYFDRTPYVEQDDEGIATYVEHHRTLGDQVRALTAAGFRLVDLVEPEWPDDLDTTWGGWSPLRGRLLPGTAVFLCERD
jgi:SAM-dependent methyltransferase